MGGSAWVGGWVGWPVLRQPQNAPPPPPSVDKQTSAHSPRGAQTKHKCDGICCAADNEDYAVAGVVRATCMDAGLTVSAPPLPFPFFLKLSCPVATKTVRNKRAPQVPEPCHCEGMVWNTRYTYATKVNIEYDLRLPPPSPPPSFAAVWWAGRGGSALDGPAVVHERPLRSAHSHTLCHVSFNVRREQHHGPVIPIAISKSFPLSSPISIPSIHAPGYDSFLFLKPHGHPLRFQVLPYYSKGG